MVLSSSGRLKYQLFTLEMATKRPNPFEIAPTNDPNAAEALADGITQEVVPLRRTALEARDAPVLRLRHATQLLLLLKAHLLPGRGLTQAPGALKGRRF